MSQLLTQGRVVIAKSSNNGDIHAWVVHYPGFVQADAATSAYTALKNMSDLQQRAISLGMQPRLTAMTGDASVNGYRYSNTILPSIPWHTSTSVPYDDQCRVVCYNMCNAINDMISQRVDTAEKFNSCLLNYYRDGNDSIGEHSDDERQLGHPLTLIRRDQGWQWIAPEDNGFDSVAIISLTAQPGAGGRKFFIRDKQTQERTEIMLESGDLLLMLGQTQKYYTHGINKSKTVVTAANGDAGRISASFRYMRPITN